MIAGGTESAVTIQRANPSRSGADGIEGTDGVGGAYGIGGV